MPHFLVSALVVATNAELQVSSLEEQLQQTLDAYLASHTDKYPNLTLSFAWKDSENEVAVTSGKVGARSTTVEDTFLYGSGTKPLTAASVLSLVDAGHIRAEDKVHALLDPYLTAMGEPTMREYFGDEIEAATVLDVIRMAAGIRDFEDDYSFDQWVLGNASKVWDAYPYDAMSFSISDANIKAGGGSGPLICNTGGNCTAYSSTSYDVAGLILAAVLQPDKPWYSLDLGDVLFDGRRDLIPGAKFPTAASKLSDVLTVPGYSINPTFSSDPITIFDQDASILGFTCGNMVATPTDVARFFYWLLDPKGSQEQRLLSDASQEVMTATQVLSKGWLHGYLAYGAGIQDRAYGDRKKPEIQVAVKGHEGATYAFLSASGYVPELKGAFSVIGNTDVGNVPINAACHMLETVKRVQTGNTTLSLGCTDSPWATVLV
jgi:CubicO group peptidase (beta-lactamase class C family)